MYATVEFRGRFAYMAAIELSGKIFHGRRIMVRSLWSRLSILGLKELFPCCAGHATSVGPARVQRLYREARSRSTEEREYQVSCASSYQARAQLHTSDGSDRSYRALRPVPTEIIDLNEEVENHICASTPRPSVAGPSGLHQTPVAGPSRSPLTSIAGPSRVNPAPPAAPSRVRQHGREYRPFEDVSFIRSVM